MAMIRSPGRMPMPSAGPLGSTPEISIPSCLAVGLAVDQTPIRASSPLPPDKLAGGAGSGTVDGSNTAAILICPVELLSVRSHLSYPLLDTLRVCSPAPIPTVDGVFPTKLPSISISAPKGSDEISAVSSPVEYEGLLAFVPASPKLPLSVLVAFTPASAVIGGVWTAGAVSSLLRWRLSEQQVELTEKS